MTRGGGGGVVTHTHSGRPSVLSATGGQGQRRRASPAPHSLPRSGHVCGGGLGGDKVWAAGAGGAGSCVRCSCRSPRHGAGGLEPRGAGLAGLLPGGSCCWGQHFSGDQGSGIRPLGDGLYSRFPRRPRGPRGSTGSGGGGQREGAGSRRGSAGGAGGRGRAGLLFRSLWRALGAGRSLAVWDPAGVWEPTEGEGCWAGGLHLGGVLLREGFLSLGLSRPWGVSPWEVRGPRCQGLSTERGGGRVNSRHWRAGRAAQWPGGAWSFVKPWRLG